MKKFLVALTYLLMPITAYAEPNDWAEAAQTKAQASITACWDAVKDDMESGTTSRMQQASSRAATCIENHILTLSENLLFKNNQQSQVEVKEALARITESTGKLYWLLNNGHAGCTETAPCGTLARLAHGIEITKRLEEILHDFHFKAEEMTDIPE